VIPQAPTSPSLKSPSLAPPFLASRLLTGIAHGFFTRAGGVSRGPYESLNCSTSSGDDPVLLRENRARVARAVGVAPNALLGLTQVHGTSCVTVERAWNAGEGPRADAMATRVPGLALGIITADCAPVLLADPRRGVVAAVHAGWRGAVAGILESTVEAMQALGAERSEVRAVIGPCIAPASYEVGEDLRCAVLGVGIVPAEPFFGLGRREGHHQFDLPGYCIARLRGCGVDFVESLGCDTVSDPQRFFSHRRRTLAGGGPIGHQISVIVGPQSRPEPEDPEAGGLKADRS
jgi:YfiH family protein